MARKWFMTFLSKAKREHYGWLLLLLVFVFAAVKYSSKATEHRSAILRWQPQIKQMANGVDISYRYNYPNPPVMAVLLYPLVQLPPFWVAFLWFGLKVGMTLLAFFWVFRLIETPDRPFPFWARAAAVLLSLRPIMSDLDHGNVNLFILFLVIACLTAYRFRHDLLAGGILALAIACKVTPALFLPYFLWKRSWRVLSGCTLGLTLFLWPGFVPALFLGTEHNQNQLASWYRVMVHPFVVEGKVTSEHNNQSLPGTIARLTTASPSFSTWINNNRDYLPTHYHNLLSLKPAHARWIVKGVMALFALLIVFTCRTPTKSVPGERPVPQRRGWPLAAEFGLILLGMLLFSERTWKHHCVTLMVPFAVLCYYLAVCQPARGMRVYLIGTLVAAALLMASTSSVIGDRGKDLPHQLHKLTQVYGAWTLANLILVGALGVLLWKEKPGRQGGAGQDQDPAESGSHPATIAVKEATPRWRASA
jgi:alpha-1,2-mannosyltransferase